MDCFYMIGRMIIDVLKEDYFGGRQRGLTEVFEQPFLIINITFCSLMALSYHYNFFIVFKVHFSLIYFQIN